MAGYSLCSAFMTIIWLLTRPEPVNCLSADNPLPKQTPETLKKSLDDVVQKLDQDSQSSQSWGKSVWSDPEKWDELKKNIQERQKELKRLVAERRAGTMSQEEFDERYRTIQDELTKLEFQVYNLRLGTSIEM